MTRQKFSRLLDQILLWLTLGFGIIFVLSEVFGKDANQAAIERVDLVFTIAFLGAFALQFAITPDRVGWLKANWLDVLIVLVVAFPLLRALRFYRYLPRALRLVRLAAILSEALRAHVRTYGRGNVYNILVAGLVIIFLGAVLVQFSEEGASEANIKGLGDALWWAVTTVTTVGYGDKYPTTTGGRIVASGLMLLGIGLFGILTASISSYFLAQHQESELARLHQEVAELRHELRTLVKLVAAKQDTNLPG